MDPSKTAPSLPFNKKAVFVRAMFNSIAWRYDWANRLLSLGVDRLWRKRLRRRLSRLPLPPSPRILDICCGTGDLAMEISPLGKVVGVDFSHSMLLYAQKKSPLRTGPSPDWVEADGLHLPFPQGVFLVAAVAFGIRNFEDLATGLRELARVLQPGGHLAILEFSTPAGWFFSRLYRFYFQSILPWLGGWITGNRDAYRYLPTSVSLFSSPGEVKNLLEKEGLISLEHESWTLGIVHFYLAQKELRS